MNPYQQVDSLTFEFIALSHRECGYALLYLLSLI
ncbi:hypothetical protein VPHK567_0371 [Vibrio phage K567]